jgi:magnesium transporter
MASERRILSLRRPRLRRIRRGEFVPPSPEREGPRVEEIAAEGLRWVKIDRPTAVDQAWLEEHFDFHALDLEDVTSRNQRPKIDEYEDYLFIVLHFPTFDPSVGRLGQGELDLFVGPGFLITIPNQPLQPVEYLFERCRQKEELRDQLFARGSGYLLYRIVDDTFDYCFPMLRKIGNKLDALEEEIFEGRSEEIVRDISNVKQEIINFRKVIRPQRPVLRDLEKVKGRYLAPDLDLEIYFDDIVDAHERIWDMLENDKEVVEALEETNESVIAHRFNDVLRILTVLSIVFLPATLIASIWGMNVGLPGGGDPATASNTVFWIIIAAMVAFLVGMLALFRRRGWL